MTFPAIFVSEKRDPRHGRPQSHASSSYVKKRVRDRSRPLLFPSFL